MWKLSQGQYFMNRNQHIVFLLGVSVIAITVTLFVPPIAQDPNYHNLSDRRVIAGIPNFWDVVSNLAFLIVGVLGLWTLFQIRGDRSRLILKQEMIPFAVAFAGTILIFAGSAYYHWAPSNETLVWDRLPMTLAFMGILSMVIVERIGVKVGINFLVPLLVVGVASVAYWYITERSGQGDLRPYALVQFLPALLIPVILWLFPARYSGTRYLVEMIGWYVLAKGFEFLDAAVWGWTGGWIAGHSLKHCVAAGGVYALVRYLKHRRALPVDSPKPANQSF
jgi:ceramidase